MARSQVGFLDLVFVEDTFGYKMSYGWIEPGPAPLCLR